MYRRLATARERSDTITVFCCVSATGRTPSPTFFFPGKSLRLDRDALMPPESRMYVTELGWITADAFLMRFNELFVPSLPRESQATPALLILDGHATHRTLRLVNAAMAVNVHLFLLPSHETHFNHRRSQIKFTQAPAIVNHRRSQIRHLQLLISSSSSGT